MVLDGLNGVPCGFERWHVGLRIKESNAIVDRRLAAGIPRVDECSLAKTIAMPGS